jgi:hypothetical protein
MTAFRLGRNKLPALPPMLRLRNYLLASLPPPPPARSDWAAPAIKGLELPLGNDQLGDCTCGQEVHDLLSGVKTIGRRYATRRIELTLTCANSDITNRP